MWLIELAESCSLSPPTLCASSATPKLWCHLKRSLLGQGYTRWYVSLLLHSSSTVSKLSTNNRWLSKSSLHHVSFFASHKLHKTQNSNRISLKAEFMERGTRKISSFCWFIPQVIAAIRAGLGRTKNQELYIGFPLGRKGPSTWTNFHCFSRYISRELDWNCSSWDLNQCPHVMLALQVPP